MHIHEYVYVCACVCLCEYMYVYTIGKEQIVLDLAQRKKTLTF